MAARLVEKSIAGEQAQGEAGLGPVKYLTTAVGADNETVLRWFIRGRAVLAAVAGGAQGA